MLRRRALHARAKATGHHDCCELVGHVRREWLGRQDSNLGSRDQNPLPYHLATPQRGLQRNRVSAADGGRVGKADTASMVGAAKRGLSTWLRPNEAYSVIEFRQRTASGRPDET